MPMGSSWEGVPIEERRDGPRRKRKAAAMQPKKSASCIDVMRAILPGDM